MSALKELQNYTFISKYARYNPQLKRRETWKEAVDRVRNMMLEQYQDKGINDEINWAYDLMFQKRVLGSQRALQFGGKPVFDHHTRSYNCSGTYCDRARVFQEIFYVLLCGSGVGYSVSKKHIHKLPKLVFSNKSNVKNYTIADSIEGWADSVGVLLSNYFESPVEAKFEEYGIDKCGKVGFDYSLIRPKGAYLSSSSGRAPGPEPLKNIHDNIRKIIDRCRELGLTKLRSIDVHDIICHIADGVLSGGVRRSSCICLFDYKDKDMRECKSGNWHIDNPQRARANNSVILNRNTITQEEFDEVFTNIRYNGEPGFLFTDDEECVLTNPCITKDTLVTTNNGINIVQNLIKHDFTALVDGDTYTSNGFWKTGKKAIYKISCKYGHILKATDNHLIQTIDNKWVRVDQLKIGDKIRLHNHRNYNPAVYTDSQEYAKGYLFGSFIGDGNFANNNAEIKWWGDDKNDYRIDGLYLLNQAGWLNNHHMHTSTRSGPHVVLSSKKLYNFAINKLKVNRNNKVLTQRSMCGSWSYLAGVIAGYIDADGYITNNTKKGSSIRLTSVSKTNLRLIQQALLSFGIMSKIYFNRKLAGYKFLPDGHGSYKKYKCKSVHELCIANDNILRFNQYIQLRNTSKYNKLQQLIQSYKRRSNKTSWEDTITSIQILSKQSVYDCQIDKINALDANGFYIHNCGEVGLYAYNNKGKSGFQFCNLTSINCGKITSEEDLYECCKAAAIIGTLQAGFTSFPYLGKVTEEITQKEALLGVSLAGMMEKEDITLDSKIQQKAAQLVLKINAEIAEKIGINKAARCTVEKPDGQTGTMLSISSGIHPHHSKRYLRRVQANHTENPFQLFKKYNAKACELSVWSANKTDDVISFPIEVPDGVKTKNQLSALQMLENVRITQNHWIKYGKRQDLCVQEWLSHAVSNTVVVKDDEWDDVLKYVFKHRKDFAGITFLPQSGDKDYPQAPFCAVYTSREIVKEYGEAALWCSGLIELCLRAFEDNLWKACDAILNDNFNEELLKSTDKHTSKKYKSMAEQVDIWERARKFASKYFNGDVKKLTYCLKDVSNWKTWNDLQHSFTHVSYEEMTEDADYTKLEEVISCSGGACNL